MSSYIFLKSAGHPPVPIVGVTGVNEDKTTDFSILPVRHDSLEATGGVCLLKHAQIRGL